VSKPSAGMGLYTYKKSRVLEYSVIAQILCGQ
jgi:hypothetical protein